MSGGGWIKVHVEYAERGMKGVQRDRKWTCESGRSKWKFFEGGQEGGKYQDRQWVWYGRES